MKLISWNVNGLRAVHKKGFLDWFAAENADIVCVQETKAHPEQLADEVLNIAGYTSHFSSAEKKGYSGVGVWTRHAPDEVAHGFGTSHFDSEGRILRLDYPAFTLFNIYFPNGGASEERLAYKMDFYKEALAVFDGFVKAGHNVIICGDVNTAHKEIDLARPKENEKNTGFLPMERAWIDELIAHGYHDTFRMFSVEGEHYSWWDFKTRARERNVGWRIDYFFVSDNAKNLVTNAFIQPQTHGSDHCPIGIVLNI